jgi:hypothetical protein
VLLDVLLPKRRPPLPCGGYLEQDCASLAVGNFVPFITAFGRQIAVVGPLGLLTWS